jgi:hypothetical protein
MTALPIERFEGTPGSVTSNVLAKKEADIKMVAGTCYLAGGLNHEGNAYHLPMATLGHWNNQGVMYEEYLFWDNATLMQQIGVGK